ncbi:Uncharacterised protein [Slackia heliotrinireducens]|uniref:Uncharacterized protein n=1 Tax=Slackia heliotrinireducens (strain ATCC 29202 / DSM 20476 / NCTC 11029 / RHS 1) TaxID=471855 RepID=C7N641_SLAHD|nr:hypothetical protein [Slackia heliotrinireducens]ACV22376.1 hypothetical protein Shel_13530 [Slackia heliotrinireducens DSM 20476]VEH00665.1 Uncharacterised protein [Slackia heliotrinireducens]
MIVDKAVIEASEDFAWDMPDTEWIPTGRSSAILYVRRDYGCLAVSLHLQKHTVDVLVSPAFMLPDIGFIHDSIRHFLFQPNDFVPECEGDFADIMPVMRTGELTWTKTVFRNRDIIRNTIQEGIDLFDNAMPHIMEFVRQQCRGGMTQLSPCVFDDTSCIDIF